MESIKLSATNKNLIIYIDLYNKLNDVKNKIDDNASEWDKMKKVSNPYELIHISYNKDKNNNSIARYIPLSRSYFKLWELIYDYNLFKDIDKNVKIAGLAEGPGGFLEAIHNYRKGFNDKIYGITLPPTNKHVPGWKKMGNIDYCEVVYGNLYILEDIKRFGDKFKDEKAYIITADGGFDYSSDFNNQEKQSYRIIFCEIVTALSIQAEGGMFICKIFDIFTLFTMKMIYLLFLLYDNVYITKPKTSRSANSEKYIVAKGFRGIDEKLLLNLLEELDKWEKIESDNNRIVDMEGLKLSNEFIHFIYKYNIDYVEKQLYYIQKTLNYVEDRPEKHRYIEIIKEQTRSAIEWCKKYYVDINIKSKYLYYK